MARRIYFYITTALIITMILNILDVVTQDDSGILDLTGLEGFKEETNNINSDSSFFKSLFDANIGLLIIGLGGGIALTFFSRSPSENYLILPFITTTLVLFIGAMWNILIVSGNYENWIRIPMIIFFGPFTIGYVQTMVEFFRGNV